MTFTKIYITCLLTICAFKLCAQDFQIDNYDVSIRLNNDGSFDVTEKIDVDFYKKMRGIYRNITTTRDLGEYSQTVHIKNINTGKTNKKVSKKRNELEIRLGSADKYLKGLQSYIINYTVENGITPYDQHDEFYWSLTGNNWKEKIKTLTFSIEFPNEINLSPDDIAVYTDKSSNAQHANVRIENNTIKGSSLDETGEGEGISIAFKTPKAYFSELDYDSILKKKSTSFNSGSRVTTTKKVYPRDFGFPIPGIMIIVLWYLFNRKGKNKEIETIGPTFYPPHDVNPPEIGVFHDFQVNKRDLISLIPYWGEKGYLKVASLVKDDGAVDMRFEKQLNIPLDTPAYEVDFFNAIFKSGDTVYLHALENEMYKSFSSVGKSLKTEVLEMKLYDNNARRTFHSGKFILFGILSLAAAIAVAIIFHAFSSAGLLALLGILCFYVHFQEPKKNEDGLRLHAHLNSLKNTLENPNPDELNRILEKDPTYLDKIFPYVVAFGLDESWTKHVSPIFNKAPEWYYGDDMTMRPDFHSFNEGFSTSRIGKTMTSSPVADDSSSAFGGSGGGRFRGSSGGGFGGSGGGGGW